MKKWLGFIAVLIALLIPMPVMAIGVTPFDVSVDVPANGFAVLTFIVTGSSAVDITLEGIPLAVEPSHTFVVDNKIEVKILGDLTVPSGVYNGHLIFMDSGQQVGGGVQVNVHVNYLNGQSVGLTTTVVSSGGGYYGGGGSGMAWPRPPLTTPSVTSPPIIPPTEPNNENLPPGQPTYTPPVVPPVTPPETPSGSPSWFYLVILIAGLFAAYGLYRWFQKRSEGDAE